MSKDHSDSNDSENSLYNAMIIALSIGIVIVIVTLFLTRPAPESFTELYFNDHKNLPEYTDINQVHDYSFTLHNLENTDTTYNYVVQTEYYDFNYTCEKPELWLEKINNTRISETNDPLLYIKDDSYSIKFNYETKVGNTIAFAKVNTNNNKKYEVLITQDTLKYITSGTTTIFKLTNATASHKFIMDVTPTTTTITLDSQVFTVKTSTDYTHGFIHLETLDTYAEFTNFNIQRDSTTGPVLIRFDDAKYNQYKLSSYTESLNNVLKPNESITLSNYTLKTIFRSVGNITLKINSNTKIFYDKSRNALSITTKDNTQTYTPTTKSQNDLSVSINDKTIDVYYNNNYITSIDNTNATIKPEIIYKNIIIDTVSVKSNIDPTTIEYIIPGHDTTTDLITPSSLPQINTTKELTAEEKEVINSYYDTKKLTFKNYRLTVTYSDRTGAGSINVGLVNADKTIYSILMNDSSKTSVFTYPQDETVKTSQMTINPSITNRMILDVKDNLLIATLNNNVIFNKTLDSSTDGVFVFDNKGVTILDAKIEDIDEKSTIIFKKSTSTTTCENILLNEYTTYGTVPALDNQFITVKKKANFNQTFDIAKVQVSINDTQEIHFWTKMR